MHPVLAAAACRDSSFRVHSILRTRNDQSKLTSSLAYAAYFAFFFFFFSMQDRRIISQSYLPRLRGGWSQSHPFAQYFLIRIHLFLLFLHCQIHTPRDGVFSNSPSQCHAGMIASLSASSKLGEGLPLYITFLDMNRLSQPRFIVSRSPHRALNDHLAGQNPRLGGSLFRAKTSGNTKSHVVPVHCRRLPAL
jgi:hypothetical protein